VKRALFVWHDQALSALLSEPENSAILKRSNWPQDIGGLIDKPHATFAEPGELFDLIADAFAHYTNPGRTYTRSEALPTAPRSRRRSNPALPVPKK
jgi:hypothetical protein